MYKVGSVKNAYELVEFKRFIKFYISLCRYDIFV